MGSTIECCVASGDVHRAEERELTDLTMNPNPQQRKPDKTPGDDYMNKIVSNANKRVRQLKRQQTQVEEDIESISALPYGITPGYDEQTPGEEKMDLSSICTALDWSPKGSPKRKNKPSFVRLSSYENEAFSSHALTGM